MRFTELAKVAPGKASAERRVLLETVLQKRELLLQRVGNPQVTRPPPLPSPASITCCLLLLLPPPPLPLLTVGYTGPHIRARHLRHGRGAHVAHLVGADGEHRGSAQRSARRPAARLTC